MKVYYPSVGSELRSIAAAGAADTLHWDEVIRGALRLISEQWDALPFQHTGKLPELPERTYTVPGAYVAVGCDSDGSYVRWPSN